MKVTIEEHRGLLRLRLNDGKRRCIALGVADSTVGRSLALQKKAQIEIDWQIGQYDYQAKEEGLSQSSIVTRYIALRKFSMSLQTRSGREKPTDLQISVLKLCNLPLQKPEFGC
jgi:hypothetical protein